MRISFTTGDPLDEGARCYRARGEEGFEQAFRRLAYFAKDLVRRSAQAPGASTWHRSTASASDRRAPRRGSIAVGADAAELPVQHRPFATDEQRSNT